MCFFLEPIGDDGSRTGDNNGMNTAIYAGAAAAGVLLIIGIVVIIVLWRRRKPSSDDNGEYFFHFRFRDFYKFYVVSNLHTSQQFVVSWI